MTTYFNQPLFIFEMANNHMGDVNHGLRIIREIHEVSSSFDFTFAFKFQMRTIPDYIHPDYRARMDLKYVRRFTETSLNRKDFERLVSEVRRHGMLCICTPFDEPAVETVVSMGFDIIKIASCSFTDWPLLETIVLREKSIIASTAGAELIDIDNVVSFFQHRNKEFALLHCVGEYPTAPAQLQLNQISILKNRYPDVIIGYSTHEDPGNMDSIKLAVAQGAMIFEKHVAVETDVYPKNAYSATPDQIHSWLQAARQAFTMCGVKKNRHGFSDKEKTDLRQFKRGVYVSRSLHNGDHIHWEDCYFSWPNQENQLLANDFSKYKEFIVRCDLGRNDPVTMDKIDIQDNREKVYAIIQDINRLINQSNIPIPGKAELEISHHYGIDKFYQFGITMVTVVNRDYCKKYIIVLPGQRHPEQFHRRKEETFVILYGSFEVVLDGKRKICSPGDVLTVKPGVKHAFSSDDGGIMEEISTTHFPDDSFYTDSAITRNKERKTILSYWLL